MSTKKEINKPFYLHPPWDILFNLDKIRKIDPWSIDIAFLLLSFLNEMERKASVDFRASGVALDSSASIHLMKTNLLLKLEEPPKIEEKRRNIDFVPPPLVLPLRYELTTTTIQNLLKALDEVIRSESLLSVKAPPKPVLPPPPEVIPSVSVFLMEIEEEMEKLMNKMLLLVRKGEVVSFSRLIEGLERIEAIKTFLILLFLAQKRKVTLWQHDDLGEIYVTLNEVNEIGVND